jgi:DNA-binding LacI/PurR family transcriptional regulator
VRRVTIKDVAREASVSTTTVSDALNGRGRLPEQTRDRVVAAAERLGYRPNATARRLRLGHIGTIGLYTPLLVHVPGGLASLDFYMRFAAGAAAEALAHDLALVLLPPSVRPESLDALHMDGALVIDPMDGDGGVQALVRSRVPIVTCDADPTPGAAHAGVVEGETDVSLRALLDHMADRGAMRIALIRPPDGSIWGPQLEAAYVAWSERERREMRVAEVPIASIRDDVHDVAASMLDAADRPDGIIVAPQDGAIGVLRAAQERGLRVPRDLLVASCVDSPAQAAAAPSITATDLQPDVLGRTAMRLLADVLADRAEYGQRAVVPARLVIRESTLRRASDRRGRERRRT